MANLNHPPRHHELLDAHRRYLLKQSEAIESKQLYLQLKAASMTNEMAGGAFGFFKDMLFPDKIMAMNVSCSKRAVEKTNVKNASALVQTAFSKFSTDIESAFSDLREPRDIDALASLINSYIKVMKKCSSSKKKAFRQTSDKLVLLKKQLSSAVIDLEHGDLAKEGSKLKLEQRVAKLKVEVKTLEASVGKVTAERSADNEEAAETA